MPLIEQAVDRIQQANRPVEAQMRLHLAGAYIVAGRLEEAAVAAELALALVRERSGSGVKAYGLRLRSEITWQGDRRAVDAPNADLRDAMAVAGRLGMRPLNAHCHLGLGKLYRHAGKHEQAQEHLTTAATMYGEMGMTYWLEKAQAEFK